MATDSNNKAGTTILWKTLNGKSVKTDDGSDLGKIKQISENYLLLEKGKVRKEKFWIPKYVADAFDGKTLWLLMGEDELRERYQYGTADPPPKDKYVTDFESFRGTSFGQKADYGTDFDENIRVVENYKNIRELK